MTDNTTKGLAAQFGTKCEICVLEERIKKNGEVEVLSKGSFKSSDLDPHAAFALVARKAFDKENVLTKVLLKVNSYPLLRVFKEVVGFYPTIATDFDFPFEMEAPFGMLYHYWDDLKAYPSNETDDLTRMHLKLLLEYMEEELGPAREQNENMISRGFVSYGFLWTIFKPGDIHYMSNYGYPRLLRLEKTSYGESTVLGKYFEVHCTYVDFNGDDFGQAKESTKLRENQYFGMGNAARITHLQVYPRKFVRIGSELEDKLRSRGLEFFEHRKVEIVRYQGRCEYLKLPPGSFYHPERAYWSGAWLPREETGRVILDRKTFAEDYEDEQVGVLPMRGDAVESRYTVVNDDGNLDPILCPSFVYGFSLQRKIWCRFFIDCITPIEWKPSPMNNLILPQRQKSILMALTASHQFPIGVREQVEQKGKGLVILLHGTPGSGKTLSAESSAEATQRGLLSITMGELNSDGGYMFEAKLQELLRLATTWGAVVLIDEADIFLEHRKSGPGANAENNALVAVFLRHLEYFSGIIFLTSNRVGVFDTAVTSRIHLALQYSPPSVNTRLALWSQSLGMLQTEDIDVDVDEVLSAVRLVEMNGREISNTLNTAMTLARHGKEKLRLEHIENVIRVWKDFHENIARMADEEKTMPRQDSILASASSFPKE